MILLAAVMTLLVTLTGIEPLLIRSCRAKKGFLLHDFLPSSAPPDDHKLPLDDIYIVDSNLVIAYLQDDIVGWKEWADEYIETGKQFLMLPQTIREVSVKCPDIPSGFTSLILEDEYLMKSQKKLNSVYNAIVKEFQIGEKLKEKMKIDIELITEAGYYAGCAISSQISPEAYLQGKVVFASANFRAIKKLLWTKEKRDIVEKIIDDNGFEHLITVRLISDNIKWKDFW